MTVHTIILVRKWDTIKKWSVNIGLTAGVLGVLYFVASVTIRAVDQAIVACPQTCVLEHYPFWPWPGLMSVVVLVGLGLIIILLPRFLAQEEISRCNL